jgi:hypothetical protein
VQCDLKNDKSLVLIAPKEVDEIVSRYENFIGWYATQFLLLDCSFVGFCSD